MDLFNKIQFLFGCGLIMAAAYCLFVLTAPSTLEEIPNYPYEETQFVLILGIIGIGIMFWQGTNFIQDSFKKIRTATNPP